MGIQSAINSMIGSTSHAVMAVKGYKELKAKKAAAATQQAAGSSPQAQAAQVAKQSAANEMQAKQEQKRNFMEYLGNQPTSLGGKVSDLPPLLQKQIASQYSESQRNELLRGERNGKH